MRALTDNVPLRTTAVWSRFAGEPRAIAHRYGATEGELLQYDAGRRLFVWADHASAAITEVLVDGQRLSDWRWFNGTDSSGHPVTFVEFGQPVDAGATPSAVGLGKLHARTGVLIENPADALWDVLANVAGRPLAEGDLDAFRGEAARLGLRVAGSLEDPDVSLQRECSALCDAVGAVYCATMTGVGRVYPGAALEAYVAARVAGEATCRAEAVLDDLANVVLIRFDWRLGAARRTLELEAPESVAAIGRRELHIDARWIADGRLAYEVALRRLQHVARPRWRIRSSGHAGVIRVGQTVEVDHVRSPYAGLAMIDAVELDVPFLRDSSLACTVAVGEVPVARLVRQSAAFTPQQYAGVSIATSGSDRILTVVDDDGSAIGGAKVTLDGGVSRYTDAAGRVSFPVSLMPPGEHTLVVTQGERTLTITVLVP